MKYIINSILFIAVCGMFAFIINEGIKADAVETCHKLRMQAFHFRTWYATANERAMCEAIGLPLPKDKADALD